MSEHAGALRDTSVIVDVDVVEGLLPEIGAIATIAFAVSSRSVGRERRRVRALGREAREGRERLAFAFGAPRGLWAAFRTATAFATFACAIVFASIGARAGPAAAERSPYLHALRLIGVGGHKLNLYCTGSGSPSVILDAGEGDTMYSWRKVQPSIAKFARVCSFDRAGMGFSQAGPLPRDANAMVADERALLRNANVAPPYVLVGHSIAGLYAPLFADRYPSDVAGMVLVDPSYPNQTEELHAVSPTMRHDDAAAAGAYDFCYRAALHGKLGLARGAQKYAICGFPPNAAANLKADCAKNGAVACELERISFSALLRPAFWSSLGSEDAASSAVDSAENRKARRPFGMLPLIVLTAADDIGDSPLGSAEMRAIDRVWTAGHERVARSSSVGVHFVVAHTGHYIQLDRPAVVTGAVAEVVSQAKRR